MSSLNLTTRDYGPKRRLFDTAIKIVVAFFLGWAACGAFYNVERLSGLTQDSSAWFRATEDRFNGICSAIYGPEKTPR